jgi:SAM-dependent methyltransferase
MPSDAIDFSRRAELTEMIDEPCSREELRACLRDLERLNRWFLGYRPILRWLDSAALPRAAGPLRILDVGCGYGDTLRRIELWARARGVAVELTGLDINPDAVAVAAEATLSTSAIRWVARDVFAYRPGAPVDFVISSLFTHHLTEDEVVRFIEWLEITATKGWFINDLSRAAIPYHLLRIFSKLAGLHRFVQNDGPVSIARAFVREDWRRMCSHAGLDHGKVSIQPFKPARLCVSRRKSS